MRSVPRAVATGSQSTPWSSLSKHDPGRYAPDTDSMTGAQTKKPGEIHSRPAFSEEREKCGSHCIFCIVTVTVESDPAVRLYETQ